MRCRGCQEQLSAFVDGGLGERRARAVAEHLAGCAVCRSVREDLMVMCEQFRALGMEALSGAAAGAGVEGPGEAMWRGIEAGLDAEEARARDEARRLFRRIPALAPATAALLIAGGAGAGMLLKGRAATASRNSGTLDAELLRQAGAVLSRTESEYRGALDALCATRREDDPDPNDPGWQPVAEATPSAREMAALARRDPADLEARFAGLRSEIARLAEAVIPATAGLGAAGQGATRAAADSGEPAAQGAETGDPRETNR